MQSSTVYSRFREFTHFSNAILKRLLDISAAATGLLVLSPLLLAVALAVAFSSRGGIIFRQLRIGRHGRPFQLLKFRTMVKNAEQMGPAITCGDDSRITPIGRFLRNTKIDELPQLINIIKGDMSLVGPRPEVARYVNLFPDEFREILQIRPGITDLASIRYRNEASLLGVADDPEAEYVDRILPEKIDLAKEYIRRSSVILDLVLIVTTLSCLFRKGLIAAPMSIEPKPTPAFESSAKTHPSRGRQQPVS